MLQFQAYLGLALQFHILEKGIQAASRESYLNAFTHQQERELILIL